MARSLPVYLDQTIQVTLSDGAGSVTALTGIPERTLLRGFIMMSTEGSPDGLFQIDFYADSSGQRWRGGDRMADMGGGTSIKEVEFTAPRPFFDGVYYQVTGDGDSTGDGVAAVLVLQVLA